MRIRRFIPKMLQGSLPGCIKATGLRFLQVGLYLKHKTHLRELNRGSFHAPQSRVLKHFRYVLLLVIPLALLLLPGCRQYYLSVCQEWVDARYLASTNVSTPDPRQDHPPIGQMLILDWRVPSDVFKKKPEVVLDLVLWDYTSREIRIPINRRMDFATYRLFNEDYEKSGGILTYKAKIVTEDGKVFREWKHQLWVSLITVTDDRSSENESALEH